MTSPSTTDAAIFLLAEKARDHERRADRAKISAVYSNAAPVPETVEDAVKITERAVFESVVADALHHEREAARFVEAIETIKAAK
jgi:hypothetical protein